MPAPHPLKGRPVLVWIPMLMQGHQAFIEQQAQYHRQGRAYTVRRFFAQVIYRDQESLFGTPPGWVVSQQSFDELRSFPTLADAKLYVESLFALEDVQ